VRDFNPGQRPLWVISGHLPTHFRMSALLPKADIIETRRHVRFVPLADMWRQAAPLFDHLVGKQLHRRRYVETQCLSGLHIDDKLEFGRLLNRQIGGLRPF